MPECLTQTSTRPFGPIRLQLQKPIDPTANRTTTMKKTISPELAKAINQQAHHLAAQSFSAIRMALQEKANTLLKDGRSPADILRAIRTADTERWRQVRDLT